MIGQNQWVTELGISLFSWPILHLILIHFKMYVCGRKLRVVGMSQGGEGVVKKLPRCFWYLILLGHSHYVNIDVENLPHYSLIIGLYIQLIPPWL